MQTQSKARYGGRHHIMGILPCILMRDAMDTHELQANQPNDE